MGKKYGQHFLVDKNILSKIENILPKKCDSIVEVGPGYGALTDILIRKTKNLHCIEIDSMLGKKIANKYPSISINICDAMKYDFSKHKNSIFVSNLPYEISTKLLLKLFQNNIFSEYYVMLQNEVANRIISNHNKKTYGKLSILSQYSRKILHKFNVSAKSFSPIPKVESAFLHIKEEYNFSDIDFCFFSQILQKAFSYRRKKLSNSIVKKNHQWANQRPENLSIKEWTKIYYELFLCEGS